MAGEKTVETTGLLGWLDRRFPVTSTWKAHLSEYYAPKNFNFWYFFGSLALVLVLQIVTGIFLVMHYKPDAERAFQSVEYIMREVPWGWLVRYMHSTGASMFFVVVYLHMLRGLLYGSPQAARTGLDLRRRDLPLSDGGSLLRLPAALGPDVLLGRPGDREPVRRHPVHRSRAVDLDPRRLRRVRRHAEPLLRLPRHRHPAGAGRPGRRPPGGAARVGSNNPDGVEIKQGPKDSTAARRTASRSTVLPVHDLVGVAGFLLVFAAIVFFAPEMGGYFLSSTTSFPPTR